MKNNINKSLDGIYEFMADAYHGNWQYRWNETPYLQKSIKASKKESITGHQWACIGFWFYLRRLYPSLGALVNTAEIYERLWSHDIGETFTGDISQVVQLKGEGVDKHAVERKEMKKMGKMIPRKILRQLIQWFDDLENKSKNNKKLEALIVKFIDRIQGNHFALVFGNNLPENSTTINKVMTRSFLPIAKQLLKVLKDGGRKKAYIEVENVIAHHLKVTRKAGIKISLDFK